MLILMNLCAESRFIKVESKIISLSTWLPIIIGTVFIIGLFSVRIPVSRAFLRDCVT